MNRFASPIVAGGALLALSGGAMLGLGGGLGGGFSGKWSEVTSMPPVFAEKSVEEAHQAAGDEKLVLVDATAVWCPPCQLMDQTTWVDERLVQWIEANAVAVQLDVDEEPELARELRIRAMPTVVVFRSGEEVDRVVGYRDGEQMLAWLENVQAGEPNGPQEAPPLDQKPAAGDPQAENGNGNLARVRVLMDQEQFDEATDELIAVWNDVPRNGPAVGPQHVLLLPFVEELLQQHEPARERFAELRDQTETRLHNEPTWTDLSSWIALNNLLDQSRIIAWAERMRDEERDQGGLRTLRQFEPRVRPVFEEHNRLDLVGWLVADPQRRVRTMWEMLDVLESPEGVGVWAMMDDQFDAEALEPEAFDDPELQREIRNSAYQQFRERSSHLYTSLLAAGRDEEAGEIAEFILQRVDEPLMRLMLIEQALDHNQARPEHLEWLAALDPAEAPPAQVHELEHRLRTTLGPAPEPTPQPDPLPPSR